jgi:hypothetical protein
LQELPILLQLRPVDLGPRFDETLLRPRQAAPEALDSIDGEHGRMFLLERVNVRSMMPMTVCIRFEPSAARARSNPDSMRGHTIH